MTTQKKAEEKKLYWVTIISAAFTFVVLVCNILMKPPAWLSYILTHPASRASICVLLTLVVCVLVAERLCRRIARGLASRVR
jgi:uncharacterized protein (DUF983 family)